MALAPGREYVCGEALNLYKTPELEGLVTQAAAGRHLRLDPVQPSSAAWAVTLCEDDYPGWIGAAAGSTLRPAEQPYHPVALDRQAIAPLLPQVIAFAHRAMATPNTYLWGGTLGPNYDCSGLMQAAFASTGIRLPRDSYQQEAFTQPIAWDDLEPGDLIFFGTPERTKHVALYLGGGQYIHSSGVDQGRNGIGIDSLTDLAHPVSAAYHRQLRRAGRVVASYCPAAVV
ncbi:C40 family peptidase [Leptolyngbya sp. KIOST-1]|uniref:C40 family peptidase n=1 Tax=Leptolyngbya sp. KIOST-1 TaxID=1229172 RepID=UPI000566EE97|nr:C40 family peptidase [Leptolyngbya sp. KIOST-1]